MIGRRVFPKVGLEALRRAVESHCPDGSELQPLGGYLGRSEVFAIPKARIVVKVFHHDAAVKSQREILAYHFLADKGLPVPQLRDSGVLSDGTPWIAIDYVPGVLLEDLHGLGDNTEQHVYIQMGRMLATFRALAVPVDFCDALGVDLDAQYARNAQILCEQPRPERPLFAKAAELLKRLTTDVPRRATFVHRDFSARNILVVPSAGTLRISGLIDFERASVADPTVDVAMLWFKELATSEARRKAFLQGYSPDISITNLTRGVAYHAIGLLLEISKWANADDPDYYARALHVLQSIVDCGGSVL